MIYRTGQNLFKKGHNKIHNLLKPREALPIQVVQEVAEVF